MDEMEPKPNALLDQLNRLLAQPVVMIAVVWLVSR